MRRQQGGAEVGELAQARQACRERERMVAASPVLGR